MEAAAGRLLRPAIVPTPGRSRRPPGVRTGVVVLPIIAFLALWLAQFVVHTRVIDGPGARVFGGDFAMFVSGAQVVRDGRSPYDPGLLYRTERALFQRQGLGVTTKRERVRVGNPPLFFWLLQPLAVMPVQTVTLFWILGMQALSVIAFYCCLRYLRWSSWLIPCLIFFMLPQSFKGAFYGNVSPLVFAAVGCSLLLLKRYPFASGMLLTFVWLKPQLGLPILLLITIFHARSRTGLLLGFGATTIALALLTILATGAQSLQLWVRGMTTYYHDVGIQGYLPSVTDLYDRWASPSLRLNLTALGLGIALGLTAMCWWKLRSRLPASPRAIAWLWLVWFVLIPYVHLYDEIVLVVPVLALIGRDGRRLSDPLCALGLYLLVFTWLPATWTLVEVSVTLPILILLSRNAQVRVPWLSASVVVTALAGWVMYSRSPFLVDVESLRLLGAGACLVAAALWHPIAVLSGRSADRPGLQAGQPGVVTAR